MAAKKEIFVYTDGSCLGNPGPGGYGVVMRYRQYEKKLSCGYRHTTNNRMELLAVIAALRCLTEPCTIVLTTDSQYVKNGIESWLAGWKRKNWRTASGSAVKNIELWQALDELRQPHEIKWHWVKGHAGHPENEGCDRLARTAASHPQALLLADDTDPNLRFS